MCVKVIFLDVVFNDEKNDTLVGSLSAILPDLNVSSHGVSLGRDGDISSQILLLF